MKSPLYWFLFTVSIVPFFAVGVLFFLVDFLLIDKRDEYQLISFIARFKKFFFISYGVLKGIIQYIMYYRCVNFHNNDSNYQTCNENGPGATVYFWPEAATLLL